MRLAHMGAGGKGVQALDAVGKTLIDQKLQRAIGDGGLVAEPLGGKAGQHVIGPQRAVFFQQYLQHPLAHRGQPRAGGQSDRLGPRQGIAGAKVMVMRSKGQIGCRTAGTVGMGMGHGPALTGYDITYIDHGTANRKAQSMRHLLALLLTGSAAMAEVPRVVTDIPAVHSIVGMVMGKLGTPELLLEPGADEHDFQLKPSQMEAISTADLVIWVGPDLTPWLDSALDSRGEGGAVLTLFDDVGTYKISYFVGTEALSEDHAEGTIDPHVWLDPSTARYWTVLIAAELSRIDPENAKLYDAYAVIARSRIAKAEAEAKALLDPVKDRPFVTFHDAYGYYITYFDLTPAGTLALGDASTPGALRLSELRATLEAGDVRCVFPEAQHNPGLVEQIVDGTGVRIGAALDPVGSAIKPGPDAYAALITGMAKTLAECLSDPG